MDERPNDRHRWIHEETLVALPAPLGDLQTVSSVRGSLLVASREQVSSSPENLVRYEAALQPEHSEALRQCMPSEWVPLSLACAHYAALDALRLPSAELRQLGIAVARRIHDSPFFPLVRIAAATGATPLSALVLMPKLWTRIFQGGGVAITRTGPKDAVIRAYKNPLFHSAYFRHATGGHVELTAELLSVRAYVRLLPQEAPESCRYHISWV